MSCCLLRTSHAAGTAARRNAQSSFFFLVLCIFVLLGPTYSSSGVSQETRADVHSRASFIVLPTVRRLKVCLLRGASWEETKETLDTRLKGVITTGWRFWPFVHLFTYFLIPPRHRVLWVSDMGTRGSASRVSKYRTRRLTAQYRGTPSPG